MSGKAAPFSIGTDVFYHRSATDYDCAKVSRVSEDGTRAALHVFREHQFYPVEFLPSVALADKPTPGTFTLAPGSTGGDPAALRKLNDTIERAEKAAKEAEAAAERLAKAIAKAEGKGKDNDKDKDK